MVTQAGRVRCVGVCYEDEDGGGESGEGGGVHVVHVCTCCTKGGEGGGYMLYMLFMYAGYMLFMFVGDACEWMLVVVDLMVAGDDGVWEARDDAGI